MLELSTMRQCYTGCFTSDQMDSAMSGGQNTNLSESCVFLLKNYQDKLKLHIESKKHLRKKNVLISNFEFFIKKVLLVKSKDELRNNPFQNWNGLSPLMELICLLAEKDRTLPELMITKKGYLIFLLSNT